MSLLLFILLFFFCIFRCHNLFIYLNLKDDDIVAVKDGALNIHRLKKWLDDPHAREITTLKMEIQQIMKGN